MDHKNAGVTIKKVSGETELFDISKLKASLREAGANEDVVDLVAADIANWVSDGATTMEIYGRAYKMFRQYGGYDATLYRLKKALFAMGPTGYPFEHFIGELFKRQGYEVQVGVVVEGIAITHEIDVIATKDREQNLMECKFSSDQGNRIGVQVPLYVHARVNDIVEKRQQQVQYHDFVFVPWVVTNTRFSTDSQEYCKSKGIKLMGWDYPKDHALKDLIKREKVYPVTILTQLSKVEKELLMADGIVTCHQVLEFLEGAHALGWSKRKQRTVVNEIKKVLNGVIKSIENNNRVCSNVNSK